MVQSVETTQEIQLEDIVELSMALNAVPAAAPAAAAPARKPASLPPPSLPPKPSKPVVVAAPVSSIELGDEDLAEVPEDEPSVTEVMSKDVAVETAPSQDPEDLVSTRIKAERPAELDPKECVTEPAGTLRVPSLSLAQATSALAPVKSEKPSAPAKSSTTEITQPIPRRPWARFSKLPTPVWASISAAAAALVVGLAAIAAHGSGEEISLQDRVAEREEPQTATKPTHHKYEASEEFGRWSDVPNYVPREEGDRASAIPPTTQTP